MTTRREKFRSALVELLQNHDLMEDFIQEFQPDQDCFQVTIGDWSGDGHNLYDPFLVYTDTTPMFEVQKAFIKTIKEHGLIDKKNTHHPFALGFLDDYGEYTISQNYCDILNKLIPLNGEDDDPFDDEYYIDPYTLVYIMMMLVKVNLPDFEFHIKEGMTDKKFNGYWGEFINDSYGYGLYNG